MLIETIIGVFAPAIGGYLLDKSQKVWIWLILWPLVAILASTVPYLKGDDGGFFFHLLYLVLISFSNSAMQVC
mgnify:FL=1